MKNQKTITIFIAAGFMLTGCLSPQTYFSEVFNTIYDTYLPTVDVDHRLVSNFKIEANLLRAQQESHYEVYFFETGIHLTQTVPHPDRASITQTTTTVYDYLEAGSFVARWDSDQPNVVNKVYAAFNQDSFVYFHEVLTEIEGMINDELQTLLNNQATNLLIGGQPTSQDRKVYDVSVSQYIPLDALEEVTGFIPTTVNVEVVFTTSTKEAQLTIEATAADEIFHLDVVFSQYQQVVASDHLLTTAEKMTYDGYSGSKQ